MVFSEQELVTRRIAWEGLSSLFLDTEFDDAQNRQIAEQLRGTGFTGEELEAILETELAPLLYRNLHSTAGEWSGFDLKWIEESIRTGRHQEMRKWYRFVSRLLCRRVVKQVMSQFHERIAIHLL
ncbi:MAG: hypothetical protein IPK83_07160 [Planctomycetes bacterium]|nr:hypothetical protein [Planctomycetota bacterium]